MKLRVLVFRRTGGFRGGRGVERFTSRVDDTGGDGFDSRAAYGPRRDVLALANGIERVDQVAPG